MSDLPIDFTEIADLKTLGISQEFFNSTSITFESDHFITVRESTSSSNSVAIIDLKNNNEITRKSMGGDSALMHKNSKIIAVRANGTIVQVFNLITKEKLKSFQMNDPILFWKWLDDNTLGLVTSTALYLSNINDGLVDLTPAPLTLRHASLANCQIIDFVANKFLDWFAVVGIKQENDRIVGKIQLYSKSRNVSQPIDGHVAQFATLKLNNEANSPVIQLFVTGTRSLTSTSGQLKIIEIEHDPKLPTTYTKKSMDIFFPNDANNDFPLSIKISEQYGIIYLITKYGFIHLYELETGASIFVNRITSDSIFATTCYDNSNGIACINKQGQVLTVEISKINLIPYILSKLSNQDLAIKLSLRTGGMLKSNDDLLKTQFNTLLSENKYNDAAKIAASSNALRTPETITRLKTIPVDTTGGSGNGISPLLIYFSILLDNNEKLNKNETMELVPPLLEQNRTQLFEKWLTQGNLDCSEELGDLVKQYNQNLALQCYLKSNAYQKVLNTLVELKRFNEILPFCQSTGFQPNYSTLISGVSTAAPEQAVEFATMLLSNPTIASQIDLEKVADIFFSQNLTEQGTALLLDILKLDKPEMAHLQTRVLQINLQNSPQVADAILGNKLFSHYDRPMIASLAEKAGLYQRALENYTDSTDIKRCIVHTNSISLDWLVTFFGQLNVQQSLACLGALMEDNMTQNIQIVVQVATKFSDLLGSETLIKLFEQHNSTEGLYYYLTSFINLTEDKEIVFKYCQAAAKLKQYNELERIVKDSNYYDPEKMKNFLKTANLQDPRPLIIVCDRFDYVHELVLFLFKKHEMDFIKTYVTEINPSKTPQIMAALLDVDCDDAFICNILESVVGQVSAAELTEEAEKRNKLNILLPFLEKSLAVGDPDKSIYNTLAKIYIDSNNGAEQFLKENNNYDTLIIGRYCEKRDPYLAYIAYDKGDNDADLIRITNENDMYKYQARYLLKRSDMELWNKALNSDNSHRHQLVEAITSVGIMELKDPEPVSLTVQAFMNNGLTTELIELLEKIVLQPSPFSDNTALQGLLFLSAIKYQQNKVRGYIEKLTKYDPNEIAPLCIEKSLNEEAFQIYDRHEMYSDALHVLINNVKSLDRAMTYVERLDEPNLWFQLASAQLESLKTKDAIDSFMKSNNPSKFSEVIDTARQTNDYDELIDYLIMARKTLKEPKIDGALLVAFAHLERYTDIEILLNSSNVMNLEAVGDELFEEKYYKAAKICYFNISLYSKLATTLVYLEDYHAAVETAKRASNISVWKLVNDACIAKEEFTLAQICGLNLIIHAEHLQDVVNMYEQKGYFDELLSLFEHGLSLERAHMGIFTEMAILCARYKPEKLSEHLKIFHSRINIPKVISEVESAHLWTDLIYLYCHYDEWDNAALVMLDRCSSDFDHQKFKEIIVKVSNLEIYYRAINAYVQEHPTLLIDLLATLTPRLDISRTVNIFAKSDNLPLIKPFLINVLPQNLRSVNEAYHDILIEEEDFNMLQNSIDSFDRFDQLGLAARLEVHPLIYFKRIAALLYSNNKKWSKSIEIMKTEKLWKEAIETAANSRDPKVVKKLLSFFVDSNYKEGFIALIYSAYDLVSFDEVLESAFMNSWDIYSRPYEISVRTEDHKSLQEIEQKIQKLDTKSSSLPPGSNNLMLGGRLPINSHTTGF